MTLIQMMLCHQEKNSETIFIGQKNLRKYFVISIYILGD